MDVEHEMRFLSHIVNPTIGVPRLRVFDATRRTGSLIPSARESSILLGSFVAEDDWVAARDIRGANDRVIVHPVKHFFPDRGRNSFEFAVRTGRTFYADISCSRRVIVDIAPVLPRGSASTEEQLDADIAARNLNLDDHPALREDAVKVPPTTKKPSLMRANPDARKRKGQTRRNAPGK